MALRAAIPAQRAYGLPHCILIGTGTKVMTLRTFSMRFIGLCLCLYILSFLRVFFFFFLFVWDFLSLCISWLFFFLVYRQSSRGHLHKVSWLLWMRGIFHSMTAQWKCKSIQEQNTSIHSPLDCILLTLKQQHLQGHFTLQTHIGERWWVFKLFFLVEGRGLE